MRFDSYKGNFENNKQQGKGVERTADGSVYDGEFISGRRYCSVSPLHIGCRTRKPLRRFGMGTLTYPDGMIYTGEFRMGKRHGQGSIKLPNGSR